MRIPAIYKCSLYDILKIIKKIKDYKKIIILKHYLVYAKEGYYFISKDNGYLRNKKYYVEIKINDLNKSNS